MKDIEDDIPFAVPEGWAWCRLGEVCAFLNGFAFNSKEFKNTGIPIIRISNIAYEKVNISNCVYSSELLHEDFVAKKGDLLVALSGATTGKMGVYGKEQKAYINQRVGNIRIVVNNTIIPEYRNFFLYSQSKKILTKAYGGAQPNIGGKDILEILLPLPPLAEQHRIVTAIGAIFTQIELLEQNKVDLQTAVKQAKSKILDLAIHGKLVPQDPADEPASVMLEKLRTEKEAKIAAGEIKRGKNDSYIYRNPTDNCYYQKYADGCEENISDEIPFDVPDGWAWCRLGEISSELGDGIHGTPEYKQNGSCYFINGNNLSNGKITIKEETKTVDEEQYRRYKKNLSSKTMFVSINGTLGSIAFYNNEHIVLGKSVCYFNLVNERLKYFLYFLLNSQYFQKYAKAVATGSTIKNVSLKAMSCFLIPLPSFVEQQRIVAKIEELFAQLDCITTTLAD